MSNLEWIHDIQWQDRNQPTEDIDGECLYTVYRMDFAKIPTLDFAHLAVTDWSIRALLN